MSDIEYYDCNSCGESFDSDLARVDDDGDIICPACYELATEDTLAMSHDEYIDALHYSDGDLTPEQLEAEWVKLEQFRDERTHSSHLAPAPGKRDSTA